MSIENSFEIEWQNTIKTLSDKNQSLGELEYFFGLGRGYSKFCCDALSPKIVMVGTSFPEEIIRAMGITYCYVCGGSFESSLYDNVNLPKDADDCSRSIVGILKSDGFKLTKNDVVLVPLYSDGMKKLKGLIGDIATVICYEVPSDKKDPLLQKRFADEIARVTSELKKHFKIRVSSGKIKAQCELSKKAADAFAKFENAYKSSAVLTDSAYLFVANSYKWCSDKAEWALHVEALTKEIGEKKLVTDPATEGGGSRVTDIKNYPEVMLFGSPVYAPDYKVMFVIEEMKLRATTIIHPDIEHIRLAMGFDSKSASLKGLALKYLEADISPAFINNVTMNNLVMDALKSGSIKGIIAHILKGQIEYDYVFKDIERLIVDTKIPMNRIETIYNYQDIEQLRLRLEAFSEMLNMK